MRKEAKRSGNKQRVTLIVCVDRDNDLGRKAKIEGPIIGRDKNIKAAEKLALADPTESDANCLFAAVKKYDELKDRIQNLEIVTLTGHGKAGFKSDQKINEQLDMLEKKYKIDGFILVTDGAEDDQVLPILQSRAKILSKEVIIVRQAKPVESMYYTIRDALKDPYLARIVFGIPGAIALFYALTQLFNMQSLFIQGISFIVGFYLLMKGLGIELKMHAAYEKTLSMISPQRASFPIYVGSMFLLIFGLYTGFQNAFFGAAEQNALTTYIRALQSTYLFIAMAAILVFVGRIADSLQIKKAILLRKYALYAISTLTIWIILDSATLVFLREADLNFFLFSVLISFAILLIAFKIFDALDITRKATKLLIGLPVYSASGQWLGKVVAIDRHKNLIMFSKDNTEDVNKESKFKLVGNRVVIAS